MNDGLVRRNGQVTRIARTLARWPDTYEERRCSATSLAELVEQAVPYESMPAPIDPRLRRGAFIGIGLVAIFVVMTHIAVATIDPSGPRPGFLQWFGWHFLVSVTSLGGYYRAALALAYTVLAEAGLLAIFTGGIRSAGMWGHRGACAVFVAGLIAAVPLLLVLIVCAVNLAVWGLIAAYVAALVVGCALLLGAMVRSAWE
jgi:hypothetical protein